MIEISGEWKSPHEIRKKLYENIIDEAMYIARGSEGAVDLKWVMDQPVFIRKKYLKQMEDEVSEKKKLFEDRKQRRK